MPQLPTVGFSNVRDMHKVGYVNNELSVCHLETN